MAPAWKDEKEFETEPRRRVGEDRSGSGSQHERRAGGASSSDAGVPTARHAAGDDCDLDLGAPPRPPDAKRRVRGGGSGGALALPTHAMHVLLQARASG